MIENEKVISKNPWSQWTKQESKRAQYDCIAKNIITFVLSSDEFFRMSQLNQQRRFGIYS